MSNKLADASGSNNKESMDENENENDGDLSGWKSAKLQFVRDPSGKVNSDMDYNIC